MIRRTLAALSMLTLCFVFTGCGGDDAATDTGNGDNTTSTDGADSEAGTPELSGGDGMKIDE